jgi:osmotically-inducible protein OsmY
MADRTRAEQTVRKVDGVKNVKTLRAIENAHSVNGVHRVASDIQTIEN